MFLFLFLKLARIEYLCTVSVSVVTVRPFPWVIGLGLSLTFKRCGVSREESLYDTTTLVHPGCHSGIFPWVRSRRNHCQQPVAVRGQSHVTTPFFSSNSEWVVQNRRRFASSKNVISSEWWSTAKEEQVPVTENKFFIPHKDNKNWRKRGILSLLITLEHKNNAYYFARSIPILNETVVTCVLERTLLPEIICCAIFIEDRKSVV